jgi:hypothetical protein
MTSGVPILIGLTAMAATIALYFAFGFGADMFAG